MKKEKKKKVVVAVSGGFDPLHIGHVRLFNEAKKLGDTLVVIVNNDNWLRAKKIVSFMPEEQRKEIIEAIGSVDKVIITGHTKKPKDMSVVKELREIRPHIFANGGDRKPDGVPVPEADLCNELGIEMVYNVGNGGKIESSSWLLKKYVAKHHKQKAKAKQTKKKPAKKK